MGVVEQLGVQYIEARHRRKMIFFERNEKPREFETGMWVLLHDDRNKDFPGNFDALWMGPYVVREVFSNGSFELETLEGNAFPN